MAAQAFNVSIDAGKAAATIELCRPELGNKLSADEVAELGRQIRAAGARPEVKSVVVRATGDVFCLGRASPPPGSAPKSALDIRSRIAEPLLAVYADIRATEVPVIAAVQGPAHGFGAALTGVCDMAIAADTARFSFPELDHNLPPTLAMSAVLGKVPPKRLLHMVYTRAEITAAEALQIGLVGEVVPRAGLDATVNALAGRLADRNRAALCAVKEYLGAASHLDTHAAARLGANTISVVLSSQ